MRTERPNRFHRRTAGVWVPGHRLRRPARLAAGGLLLGCLAFAAGCPSLAPLAVQWGADLISAASQNYTKQYSREVEGLLLAMYADKVAKKVPGTRVGKTPGAVAGYGQGTYDASAQSSQATDPNAAPPADMPSSSDPYASAQNSYTPTQPQDSGTYSAAPSDPSAGQATGGAAIVLDATILAQRASDRAARRLDPLPILDGDTLHDGGKNPRKGDVVKFSFRTNCDCYVYVIGVDATGYVARIYPDPASRDANPVRANQQYLVPGGSAWYGLDQYKGVEQVFFIASRQPRADIERSLNQLAKTKRLKTGTGFRAVREVAAPDKAMRGLVKVQMGNKSAVKSEAGQEHTFTPHTFSAQAGTDDIVVTRWFNHQ